MLSSHVEMPDRTPARDLRRYKRAPIDLAVEFAAKGSNERLQGRGKDISLGGMFVLTDRPSPFSTEIVVYITLPGQKAPFALPCVVRWTGVDGMGVQFGLIGARETHAITQLTRQ
jgi:c-di-GMP-binding flagellar brake protein YcgR